MDALPLVLSSPFVLTTEGYRELLLFLRYISLFWICEPFSLFSFELKEILASLESNLFYSIVLLQS